MYVALFEHKKMTALDISVGVPNLFIGLRLSIICFFKPRIFFQFFSQLPPLKKICPGETQFTLVLGLKYFESTFVKVIIDDFATE